MRPPPSRAARRAATPKGPPRDCASLRAALATARLPGTPPEMTERARAALLVWIDADPRPFPDLVTALVTGAVATAIAATALRSEAPPPGTACARGCAWCCIHPGETGAAITEAEARALHAALAPLAGQPDGRAWHREACPALDPDTRTCRAYDARPVICRAYRSTSAEACEAVARGTPAHGPGVLPAHTLMLAVHGLARAALRGTARTPTYALAAIAAAAAEGHDPDTALASARQPPAALDAERRRGRQGWARAVLPS